MKKVLLSVVLCVVTLLSFCQQRNQAFGEMTPDTRMIINEQLKSKQYDPGEFPERVFVGQEITSGFKQQLDSIVSPGSWKKEFQYGGAVESQIDYVWNTSVNQWVRDNKYEYAYNAAGRRTFYARYKWNSTGKAWDNHTRREATYDENNGRVEVTFLWNAASSQWINSMKTEEIQESEYKHTNNTFFWLSGEWVLDLTMETDLGENGWDFSFVYSSRDRITQVWRKDLKFEAIYADYGNYVQTTYEWGNSESNWVAKSKYEFTTIEKEEERIKEAQTLSWEWNNSQNDWVYSFKDEIHYDSSGNMVLSTTYAWKINTLEWKPSNRKEYTWDNTYARAEVKLPRWIALFNKREKSIFSGYQYDVWQQTGEDNYYYSDYTVSVPLSDAREKIMIYPNPAWDHLMINLPENNPGVLELYDLQGRRVLHRPVSNGEKVELGNLHTGIYLYNILLNDKEYRGKLVRR